MMDENSSIITIGTFSDKKDGRWRFSVLDGDLVIESWTLGNSDTEPYTYHPHVRVSLDSFRKAPQND